MVFEHFLELSRTFSTMVLTLGCEHFVRRWIHTARRSLATKAQQMRRGNDNLNTGRNRILDKKAEERCLHLNFKRE
ncbi:hypothetical protein LTR61_012114 [Exophiala xenobiotica]|nr:hypothetical protein LTR61_012114 [Exophiala xenobiotica]